MGQEEPRKSVTPELRDYWRIFGRYRWLMVLTVASSVVTAVWLSQKLPAIYEATTTLYVPTTVVREQPAGTRNSVSRTIPQPGLEKRILRGYFNILRSETVAQAAARRVRVREASQIRRNIKVTILEGGIFTVSVTDREPEVAAAAANAVAASVNEMLDVRSGAPVEANLGALEQELARAEDDLARGRERVRRFKERHGSISVVEEASKLIEQKAKLEADLKATEVRLKELEARLKSVEQGMRGETRVLLAEAVVSENPTVVDLRSRLARLEVDLAGASSKFQERHPEVVRLRREIEETQQLLATQVKTVVSSQTERLNPLYETLRAALTESLIEQETQRAKVTGLRVALASVEKQIRAHPRVARELAELTGQVAIQEEVVKTISLRIAEARLVQREVIQPFVVIDEASVPDRPAFPNVILNGLIAGIVGAVASAFYALLLGYLRRAEEPLVRELVRFSA